MARPSPAAALYPHLKGNAEPPKQAQRAQSSLADAMYPPPPKPDPRDVWREHQLELVGLRKVKGKR